MKKAALKVLLSAVICITTVAVFTVNAAANEINNITILGDSISEGYGLDDEDNNYGEWLGEYYSAQIDNYAVSGKTTEELLSELESDANTLESIKNADIICVSIGANDILRFFFRDLKDMAKSFNSTGKISITPEMAENLIISISSDIGPAAVNAGKNIEKISNKITDLNPDAVLVLQTVYNPFETDNEDYKGIFSTLYAFASIYLTTLNNSIKDNDKITNADIQKKLKGICPELTNIKQLDIHPNKLGHLIIAEEIVQTLKISGESSVFSENLEPMLSELSADIPDELKKEIRLLAEGEFRNEEIPVNEALKMTAEKSTQKNTEKITDNIKETMPETADSTNENSVENSEKGNISGTIFNICVLGMIAVIFIIAARDYRKKQKKDVNNKI